jgi:hypothetical protein
VKGAAAGSEGNGRGGRLPARDAGRLEHMRRLTYADKIPIPSQFSRGALADYYLDGYDFGEEMCRTIGKRKLGKMSQTELRNHTDGHLDVYARKRDSIYRSGATARQQGAWEAGVRKSSERQRRMATL